MIKLQNVMTPLCEAEQPPLSRIARLLRIEESAITSIQLEKRSVDARKKTDLSFCDTYLIAFRDPSLEKSVLKRNKNAVLFQKRSYIWPKAACKPKLCPIVVGSGPAGLFAALTLCRAGVPVKLIERGQAVEQRVQAVDTFWKGGTLLPHSNVQFGEGGAGTFSDGKLNTGIKDPRCRTVLETFYEFGANADILIKAKPHIGTDVLRDVVRNIRTEIESLGGEYLFETELIKPLLQNGRLAAIQCKNAAGEEIELPCHHLILAIGNAARNTYRTLWECGMTVLPKPFAIGVRIEHLQQKINVAQYGTAPVPPLPPAEYKLATHLDSGRGVYTFCMCPGGVVVNAASEPGTYVTNGMSYQSRSGKNANAALLVGIDEADFLKTADGSPFGGLLLQERIEQKAYLATGGKGLPAQTVGSFLTGTPDTGFHTVAPTALPNVVPTDLDAVLPTFITNALREALPLFDRKISGFADSDAVLTAPETRSSAPIRLLRNETLSSNLTGIYPCGEGAGYAGGITSSAVDGIRVAEAVLAAFSL